MPAIKKLTIFLLFLFPFILSILFISPNQISADKGDGKTSSAKEFDEALENSTYGLQDHAWKNLEYLEKSIDKLILEPEAEEGDQGALLPGGGAIAQVGGLIGYMVEKPPVSTHEYLADLGQNLGIAKPAYAQGVGWRALTPVLPLWKAFRNIAYMAFVIIFVIIGFMIMFRAKINPQTVITIQDALPKLVITLLLITFSYAIAGLMIDLIYISIYLLVGILQLGGVLEKTKPVLDILLSRSPWQMVFTPAGSSEVSPFIQGPGDAIERMLGGISGKWETEGTIFNIAGGIAKTVIAVALLFTMFKILFALLLSYLGIILSVIFAPFTILFNALPGSSSFANWIKGLLANIAPFPVVAGMFLLAAILIGPKNKATCGEDHNAWCVEQGVGFYPEAEKPGGEVWVPPMMITAEGEGGRADANAIQGLIGLGVIMMMPKMIAQVKKMLKVEPSGFGAAILGGIMAGPKAAGGALQTVTNIGQTMQYFPKFGGGSQGKGEPSYGPPPAVSPPGST